MGKASLLRFSGMPAVVMPVNNSIFDAQVDNSMLNAQKESSETSQPQAITMPGFTVAGPFVRTRNAIEMSGNEGRIGPLWNRFMQGGAEGIPGVIDPETIYAVYSDYESNETGAYDLTLGRSVRREEQVPGNMKAVSLPSARYLVFLADESSPEAIKAAWENVYVYFAHHPERRAFTYDFEQHSSAGTRIFIAIQ